MKIYTTNLKIKIEIPNDEDYDYTQILDQISDALTNLGIYDTEVELPEIEDLGDDEENPDCPTGTCFI